ncbi:hypothetical protein ACTFIV_000098 [Dictyostelium citrinum]
MFLKSLMISLYAFNVGSIIALLALSFSQITSNLDDDEICNDKFSPSITVTYYKDEPIQTLKCSWTSRSSAQRIIVSFIIIVDLVLLVAAIFKKSKINYWLITLFLFALGVGAFYTSIYDSIKVKQTKENCNFVTSQVEKIDLDVECEFKNIYATLGVSFLSAIFTILSSVLSLRYTSKIIDQGKPFFNVSGNAQEQNNEGGVDYNKLKKQHEKQKQKQQQQQQNSDFFKEESVNSENINNSGGAILSNSFGDGYPSFAATKSI